MRSLVFLTLMHVWDDIHRQAQVSCFGMQRTGSKPILSVDKLFSGFLQWVTEAEKRHRHWRERENRTNIKSSWTMLFGLGTFHESHWTSVIRQNAFEHLLRIFRFLVIQFTCCKRQDTRNVVYTAHNWHDAIDAVRSTVKFRWNSLYGHEDVPRHRQLVGQERSVKLSYVALSFFHSDWSYPSLFGDTTCPVEVQ